MWGPVPLPTNATPTEKDMKRLLSGAVPTPTTATSADNAILKKGLLRREAEIGFSKHSKHESGTVPTSHNIVKQKIDEEKCKEGQI